MPAVVNSTEGSFSGIRLAEGITACPLSLKNLRYFSLKNCDVIFINPRYFYTFRHIDD